MADLPEHAEVDVEHLVRLRECCRYIWGDQGHDRVKKEVALLLLAKAAKQNFQLRLHVVGHMLNVQLGKDWKQKYAVDIPMAQLLQSRPFLVVPTDIPNVDAVRLDVEQLESLHAARSNATDKDGFISASSKVRVVPRPANALPAATGSPKLPAASGIPGSRTDNSNGGVWSPAAATVKGVAVLAYINSMRWHEQQQINMLRQALASNIVRKATGADGKMAAVTDTQQYCVTATYAAGVIDRAWHGRYPSEPKPHSSLQDLLANDPLFKLRSPSDAASEGSNSNDQQVQLNIRLLLERMSSKSGVGGSPAAPLTPAPAGGKPLLNTAASPNAAGEAAAAKLMGLLTGKAGKPAGGAVFSRAIAASLPASATSAAAGFTAHGAVAHQQQQRLQQQRLQQQKQETSVHKKVLLNFIQQRHWDHDVEFNLMKRAVATFLVNKAAEGQQECEVTPVSIHIAKAGEVFHKVWTGRHGLAEKPYKKVADVLGNDQYFTIEDGPNHARQLVQLDIPAMVAAAQGIAVAPTEAASSAAVAGPGAVEDVQSPTAAGDAIMQAILLEDAEAPNSPTAAEQSAAPVASGGLLALDLLAFASLVNWHESHAELNLLRQQLACMMIEGAHPGLAEASLAGEPVVASKEAGRYAMSPYAAGSALMAIWQSHHADKPRPYTTLPSALEGCKYLLLRLSAGGYQVQLDVQQYMQDCTAAMQQMQSRWQTVVDISASTLISKGSRDSVSSAAGIDSTAAESVTAVSSGGSEGEHQVLQVQLPTETSIGAADCTAAASPTFASAAAAAHQSCAGSGLSAGMLAASRSSIAGQCAVALQPQVPNMQQLLNLLSHAPPGICQHAAIVWVPEATQQHIFNQSEAEGVQKHSVAGSTAAGVDAFTAKNAGFDGGYELYGIQKLGDSTGVQRMLDHLLACPIMAVGYCVVPVHTATPGSPAATPAKQQQMLLQVLAPPVAAHDTGYVAAAAVYVFEVPRKQQQDGPGGCKEQLSVLLRVLFEDARIVKLVDGLQMLPCLQQRFGINMAGVLDVHLLEGMLAPTDLLDDLSTSAADVGGLEGFIAAYNLTSGQLDSSKYILRSLMQRGCSDGKPIPAELISTAASAVRPLMPLALSILQLLPMALMRRCSIAVTMPRDVAAVAPPEAATASALLGMQPQRQQLLPLQGGFELGVSAMGKQHQQHQQPLAGWNGGVPGAGSAVLGLSGLFGSMF